ncbi:endonuclease I [Taibaiella sp. KBW10]|uniref:endonuclease n=1 Tax=Taibaiella sp. KBW10 TaxID=2153357 RepID=UPI000F5A4FA8|nr:endonuclease [Taibaiella sp. KBW10]RQO30548.1 endonuclease I [Taibaiella sp. KBW10]
MRNIFFLVILFIYSSLALAQGPGNYYSGTLNLQGYTLKAKLHELVAKKTTSWNYGDLPLFYEQTDRDLYYEQDSSIIDIYSENPSGVDPYNYYYQNNSLISGAATEGLGWNREHIYSQSFFNSYYPMYSDLHFIVPTDARVNQRRSNFPFAKVGTAAFTSLNGTKVGPSATPNYTNTVTEPIDAFKGDVARMLMYVAVRYENMLPFFQYSNVRNPLDSLSEQSFKNWYIPLLLSWNQLDPVSQKEIDRNNTVYTLQGNRNPFIDHPEWAQAIWGVLPADTSRPDAPYQVSMVQKGKSFISVTWPYVQGNGWAYEVFLNGAYQGSTRALNYTFNHLNPNTPYEIKVRSYSQSYVKSDFTAPINVTTADTDTFANDLLITKFIVGTDYNKAIEISNQTGYAVDLRHYYLNMRQENNTSGALYWSSNKIQLEGTLAHNRKLVIINPKAQLTCFDQDSADIISNGLPMNFDGKLALDLLYDNTPIDRMGDASVIGNYAVHKSLYRKEHIKNPVIAFDTAQWTVYPVDYCEGLGNPESTTGIAKTIVQKAFKIYPNPVKGGTVSFTGTALERVQEVQLISMEGKVLQTYCQPFRTGNSIVLPYQIKGLYLLIIDGIAYRIVVE